MKKNILGIAILSSLMVGCATTEEEVITDEIAQTNNVEQEQEMITIDENGVITDEIAIMSITEDNYITEMEEILTEDGYTMRIDDASNEDKSSVKDSNIIYFSFDSHKITPEMKKVIETQLEFLKKYPKIKVILEGHTDEKGSNAYNVVLGEKRANAVKKILTDAGISESQIEVISYGEMKPLTSGTTKEDHAKNRRSVFVYE